MQIDSEAYTAEEKGEAIYEVLQLATHNGINKATMLRVINFLLRLAYDIPEQGKGEAQQ
jgi:ABC-type transport system involved in cytochrome c biogenesis ATPase subunit